MILFVFEGQEREPLLFKTIEKLFFSKRPNRVICSYGTDIYSLYKSMVEEAEGERNLYLKDVFSVLKERFEKQPNNPLKDVNNRSEISEIYLFFDYDLQVQNYDKTIKKEELIEHLQELISFFDDETGNGKLYINYPMVESIRYTKRLPDSDYHKYVYDISNLLNFKSDADSFSFYGNLDFVCFRMGKSTKEITENDSKRFPILLENWKALIAQNVRKAHFICTGNNILPRQSNTITQNKILLQQLVLFNRGLVSILNSFPLFLFEYFGLKILLGEENNLIR